MGQRHGVRSVLRKIIVTSLFGALSYPLTNLLFDSQAQQLAMSAAVGAVALVVQLLVEVEQRLAAVETNQVQHAEAVVQAVGLSTDNLTKLGRKVADLGPTVPPLIRKLAHAEIERLTEFIGCLASGESTYEGEDHTLLFQLTRQADRQIDAVSLFSVDAGDQLARPGFWNSPAGQRYLALQRQAVMRGVKVRRVFIVRRHEMVDGAAFQRLCRMQTEYGVEVRILVASATMRALHLLEDYIVFDNAFSYEMTAGPQVDESDDPLLHTRRVSDKDKIAARTHDYAQLWEIATCLSDAVPVTGSAS